MKIEAVTVCVEYDDMLREVLPTWLSGPSARGVFDRVLVVTTPHDHRTARLATEAGLDVYYTWDFYLDHAAFNKGLAIESALAGRLLDLDAWVCFLDSDIALPPRFRRIIQGSLDAVLTPRECLWGCQRFLAKTPESWAAVRGPGGDGWDLSPCERVRETAELAGCLHLFWAGQGGRPRPWYPTDWQHAGGYDSVFEQSWPRKRRIAEPVVHLGEPGRNWHGRTEGRFDGAELEVEADVLTARRAARSDRERRRREGTPAIENKESVLHL